MKLSPNYKYLLDKARLFCGSEGLILDYGCGNGRIVEAGQHQGLKMYGCELFDHGSGINIRESLEQKGLLNKTVFEIVEDKIPFTDNMFDLVISNQVFEHVPNLDTTLAETHRVLKKGGKLICIFPVHECWRDLEGTLFAHQY